MTDEFRFVYPEVDSAIRQIKERRYQGSLKGYGDEVLLVGISYDKDSQNKKHTCVIESMRVST